MANQRPKKRRSASSQDYQKKRRAERERFQPNYHPPNHAKRPEMRASTFNALRQAISDKLGVPSDCRLYFLKKHEMDNLPETPRIQIKFGNSVILDADTWKVIQVNRFLPFSEMTEEKKNELEFVISKIYEHTLARPIVTICSSIQGIDDPGEMRSAGFRPGSDKGRTFGEYRTLDYTFYIPSLFPIRVLWSYLKCFFVIWQV